MRPFPNESFCQTFFKKFAASGIRRSFVPPFHDLANDPYEKINRANDPAFAEALAHLRGLFEKFPAESWATVGRPK